MGFAARMDDMGQAAWIGLLVLSFLLFWPAGLALLAYLIWSGRMGCGSRDRWAKMREKMGRWHDRHYAGQTSGNTAFDEYRAETLRRLEDEQREFFDFLERLRKAKDKAEFDQFMADRKHRPQGPEAQQPA